MKKVLRRKYPSTWENFEIKKLSLETKIEDFFGEDHYNTVDLLLNPKFLYKFMSTKLITSKTLLS